MTILCSAMLSLMHVRCFGWILAGLILIFRDFILFMVSTAFVATCVVFLFVNYVLHACSNMKRQNMFSWYARVNASPILPADIDQIIDWVGYQLLFLVITKVVQHGTVCSNKPTSNNNMSCRCGHNFSWYEHLGFAITITTVHWNSIVFLFLCYVFWYRLFNQYVMCVLYSFEYVW